MEVRSVARENSAMILVDSDGWIDYFSCSTTHAAEKLDSLSGVRLVCTSGLIALHKAMSYGHLKEKEQALSAVVIS